MKHILLILAIITMFSSCQTDKNKTDNNIEEIVFGRFYGECMGNCAPMYKLEIKDEILEMYADSGNSYFEDNLKFPQKIVDKDKIEIAKEVMDSIPLIIKEKAFGKTYGCPDCADGGGIFLRIKEKNRISKTFQFDLQNKKDIPKEIYNYMELIDRKVNEILK